MYTNKFVKLDVLIDIKHLTTYLRHTLVGDDRFLNDMDERFDNVPVIL